MHSGELLPLAGITRNVHSGKPLPTNVHRPAIALSEHHFRIFRCGRCGVRLRRTMLMFFSTAAVFAVLTFWTFLHGAAKDLPRLFLDYPESSDNAGIERLWAQYSPFFPVEEYVAPSSNCQIKQVSIIQRHGARYPTSGASKSIISAVNKLKSVQSYEDTRLEFLKDYQYDLGNDDLVGFGAKQSFEAGQTSFKRYSHLVSADNLPFVRSSGSGRVVLSATNWTAGFSKESNNVFNPMLSVIISEADGANNTLDDNNCPLANGSDSQTNQWLAVFAPPITQRLNKGASGANLTDAETYSLISLCAFDTVAHESLSHFCSLFTREEFEDFEYAGDLDKFYNTGYGNPLGPVQGVGYVNELLARLTSTPVQDTTQVNHTLDDSPLTFPLNRTIYADFSHDNQMIPIYAAIGLFPQQSSLDPTKRSSEDSTWKANKLVPFAARMAVEKLDCDGTEYVRIFVNDALQPLEFCHDEDGKLEKGLCSLNKFVESQKYARSGGNGDFEKCFET